MPYGEILSVKGTPFDFKTNETLGERFKSNHSQIKMFNGYDHNFALTDMGYRLCATLIGDKSGIKMEMYTDQPAVQIYSGNSIDAERACKDEAKYRVHGAICLETQVFPNFTKHSHFPVGFLKKDEKYDTVTAYKFIERRFKDGTK